MKLVQSPCDIAILTEAQAWENYCNGLHLAQVHKSPDDRKRFHEIAEHSLNRWFRVIYAKADHEREWDTA